MTEQVIRFDIVAVVLGESGVEVEVEVEVGTVSLFQFTRATFFCQTSLLSFFFTKLQKLICSINSVLCTVYLLNNAVIIRTIYFVELYRWQNDAFVLFYIYVLILRVDLLIVDGSGADSNGEGEDEDEDDQKRRGGRASKEGTFTILSVTTLAATVNALVVILEKVSDD